MHNLSDWKQAQAVSKAAMETDYEVRRLTALNMIRKAESVVQHEGWDQFLGILAGMLDLANKRFEHARDEALEHPEHAVVAREQRERIRTLREVMDLIPGIVNSGKAIAPTDSMT